MVNIGLLRKKDITELTDTEIIDCLMFSRFSDNRKTDIKIKWLCEELNKRGLHIDIDKII